MSDIIDQKRGQSVRMLQEGQKLKVDRSCNPQV